MLSMVNFFKGPVGMAIMGSLVTVGTAVTGVTAGPSMARAVSARGNATPATATVVTTPSPAAKAPAPPKPTTTPAVAASRTTPSPAPRTNAAAARRGQAAGAAGGAHA